MSLFSCDLLDVSLEGLSIMGKMLRDCDHRSLHAKLHNNSISFAI